MKNPSNAIRIFGIFLFSIAMTISGLAQQFTSLASLRHVNGSRPFYGSLIQGTDGNFYGTTNEGGFLQCGYYHTGCGTVFRVTPAGIYNELYEFCKLNCEDGQYPEGGLVLGVDGDFYGTTSFGGKNNSGTVFKVTRSGKLTTVHTFIGSDGFEPAGAMIQSPDGNLYGTTVGGGAGNYGSVFKMTPSGELTTVYSFCGPNCTDGNNPYGSLVEGADGNFYGTTDGGGYRYGTVFRLAKSGTLTTLHTFLGTDGAYPVGGLIQSSDGELYGTTTQGGEFCNCGTVFKVDWAGNFATIHSFDETDGFTPYAGVMQATDGNLYGVTTGSAYNLGTLFTIEATGVLTLHTFGETDGAYPYAALFQSSNGILYGTTLSGGTEKYGSIFDLDMGLGPFILLSPAGGKIGQAGGVLGQGFTGTTSVTLNGTPASFAVVSDTFIRATVPSGATSGFVTVATPTGTLTSNVPFNVIP